jgi:putative component of membrane protein insertase Oxa1/YidC/SpoIIIJ protein YidD
MYRKYKKNAKKIVGYLILFLIKLTKTIFLMPEGTCKYIPSCSNYAKAVIKIFIRIIKCNPFSKGGFDPV